MDTTNTTGFSDQQTVGKKAASGLREQILEAATRAFSRNGLKFKMQDVAEEMHISKKTIYTQFTSKEDILNGMLDYGFARIRECKEQILAMDLEPREKLRQVMIALPEDYLALDFRMLDHLDEKYPETAKKLSFYLENGWEDVEALIEQGKAQGWIRQDVNIPLLEMIFTASLQHFLMEEDLQKRNITYREALEGLMDLIMHGITEETE